MSYLIRTEDSPYTIPHTLSLSIASAAAISCAPHEYPWVRVLQSGITNDAVCCWLGGYVQRGFSCMVAISRIELEK